MQEQVLEASTLIDIATNCKKLEKLCMRLLTKQYMTKVHPNSIVQNWRPELQMAFRTFFQNLGGQLKHLEFYLLHDRMQDDRDMGYFEFLDNCQVLETFKLHERNTAAYYFLNPREENNLMKLTKLKCLKLAEVSDNFILNYDFGNLEELDFRSNEKWGFHEHNLEDLAQRDCPNLKRLYLDHDDVQFDAPRFKEMMLNLVKNFPNLKEFHCYPHWEYPILSVEYIYHLLYQFGIFLIARPETTRSVLNYARRLPVTEDLEIIMKRQEIENILIQECLLNDQRAKNGKQTYKSVEPGY